jgi:polyketide biosynthesis acyl carrier protein
MTTTTMTEAEVFEIVKAKIIEVLGDHVPSAKIRHDVSLSDLGANSLDRMEVVSLSMQALALRFPVRELGKVSNIGELVVALHERSSAA